MTAATTPPPARPYDPFTDDGPPPAACAAAAADPLPALAELLAREKLSDVLDALQALCGDRAAECKAANRPDGWAWALAQDGLEHERARAERLGL
jgi:hypothetical protein